LVFGVPARLAEQPPLDGTSRSADFAGGFPDGLVAFASQVGFAGWDYA
jgi:hypothetical protein